MSWPLASFAIVGALLLAGWVTYERSRPPARMIAIVATLAALAALGRDAFVALPEVKPITAMTFVVGYSLGPLPGFAVGAIGMLASNLLLGEGPYTPWQMVAWGLVGLLGAAVALVSHRRLPRVGLALACAAAALMAKEIMNLYEWSLGGIYTAPALLVKVAQGLPFDITDAVASALFGLAFAPELARLLARARGRMEVQWLPSAAQQAGRPAAGAERSGAAPAAFVPLVVAVAVLSACIAGAGAARAQGQAGARRAQAAGAIGSQHALSRAVRYLRGAQDANGGFGAAAAEPSSELYSAWAALGLAAAGVAPAAFVHDGHSVLDALREQAATLSGPADAERTMLALRACGVPPRRLGHLDLEAMVLDARRSDGSFGEQANLTAFAILALRAAGHRAGSPAVAAAAAWLERQQAPSGGFGYGAGGTAPDVDDTGSALEALAAAGRQQAATSSRAVAFLRASQNPGGGFPQQPGGQSNAQSTAWAVQGLLAADGPHGGVGAAALARALRYLRTLSAADGSISYAAGVTQTPVWVSAQAMMALARRPLPIAPPPAAAQTPSPPASRSLASGPARPSARTAPASAARLVERAPKAAPSGEPIAALAAAIARTLDATARQALQLIGLATGGELSVPNPPGSGKA